jgi:Anti-sigma-K factor rskA
VVRPLLLRPLRRRAHALAGLYALDALEGAAERERFERHLEQCGDCAGEVRGLTETAARLGLAAARQPPPDLRHRVMAAVATASQLPAAQPEASPRRRPRPRLAAVAAAVCLAVAVALGISLAVVQHRLDQARAREQAIAAVLGSRDARFLTAATSRGGAATVVVSPARHQMIVTAAGLPPLPAGKVYQLWLIGPPRTRSAGLLPEGQGGRQGPVLAGGVAPGDKFGMTVEPSGGTAQPTTTPIVVLTLPG